jgi:hypothetical protein
MTTLTQEPECGSAIEVHGFSCESRTVMLPRLYRVFAANGCWLVGCKRERGSVEYSFEIELAAALDLYCGLVHAGVQMTELTHLTLTGLCMLRTHEKALSSARRVFSVRLVLAFVKLEEEMEIREVTAASA